MSTGPGVQTMDTNGDLWAGCLLLLFGSQGSRLLPCLLELLIHWQSCWPALTSVYCVRVSVPQAGLGLFIFLHVLGRVSIAEKTPQSKQLLQCTAVNTGAGLQVEKVSPLLSWQE